MKFIRFFCILIVIFVLFNTFVFADNENILTVEDAVAKAVKYSHELKNLEENAALNEENINNVHDQLIYSEETTEIMNLSVKLKELRYQTENYTMNSEIEKQNIELSVIKFFTSVLNAEEAIKLYDESIKLQEQELKISEVKVNLGLLSKSEYDSQNLAYKKSLAERASKEVELNEAYISLNKVMGDDFDKKYNIVLDLEYSPLENVNLDFEINKALAVNQSIKEKENALEIARYDLDTYSSLTSSDTKEAKEVKLSQTSRSLTDEKTNLKEKMINTYNSIIKNETEYNSNIMELENMKKELEIKKVKYNLDKITQLELAQYEYEIKQLENKIQQQIYNHEILKIQFNNTNLL